MVSFLKEFTRNADRPRTIIVMDGDQMAEPRRYDILPKRLLWAAGAVAAAVALLVVGLVAVTPVRKILPGYGSVALRQDARLNAVRLASLQDSLRAQTEYMARLQRYFAGDFDPPDSAIIDPASSAAWVDEDELPPPDASDDWGDHAQPALPVVQMTSSREAAPGAADAYVASLRMPVQPPVMGYITRGFNARTGHFAVDVAVQEGSVVRSIGDGYVILADWTQDGGDAIAVQHADGYVSIYKHNQRLLKRVGDKVRDREAIAVSGNTGEATSGPHLHFELWQNGLAQDPRFFTIGW